MARIQVILQDIGDRDTFDIEVEAETFAEAAYIIGDEYSYKETKLIDCIRLS